MATEYRPIQQTRFGGGMITALESKDIPDNACVYAQNVEIGSDGAFGPRAGCTLHGDRSTDDGRILAAHTAKRRDGVQIVIRQRSDPANNKSVLEWYNPNLNIWELLFDPGTSLDVDERMGFQQWNTSAQDRTYACNGLQAWIKWTCVVGYVVSNDATSVTLDDASDFSNSGTVVINGTSYTYSGKSTNTLTGMTIVGTFAVDTGVAIVPTNPSMTNNPPLSNVFIAHLSRMWIGKNSVVVYSQTGDPEDYSAGTPRVPGDGGTEDFPEGGGDITGFASRDDLLIIMKRDVLRTFIFDQKDISENEIPVSKPLGFANNIGPKNAASVTTLLKEIFYTSGRYGMRQLTQVLNSTQSATPALDIVPLADAISPTVKRYDFGDSVAATFDQKILAACKSDSLNTGNDLVIVYDFRTKGIVIYKGWNVGAFYEYEDELYYGSSTEPNCFKCFDGYTDDGGAIESIYRTKRWNYGAPALRKETSLVFTEGRIGDGTELEIVLNLDEEGVTKQIQKTISWDGDYVDSNIAGTLGAEELGAEPLAGTIDDAEELNMFRVYLTLPYSLHYNMDMIIKCSSVGGRFKLFTIAPNPTAQREPPASRKI